MSLPCTVGANPLPADALQVLKDQALPAAGLAARIVCAQLFNPGEWLMVWPAAQDYNEAVQNPLTSFSDPELRAGVAVTDALGIPRPRSGGFADVYAFRCAAGKWAVKCFTRQVHGLRERYAAISRHLRQARLPFTVDFQYLEQGIRVRGRWFPVLKMRWVEGLLLNEFVRDNLDKPAVLNQLSAIWTRMARRLREARMAHADLQHGNVLLVPGRTASSLAVKLIDYDGMWVPALAGKKSGEMGHPNYQHPQRLREGTYSPEVDRFPVLVVVTALRALSLKGRGLWQRYDNGDNLLFKEADLRDPARSALFAELRGLSDPLLGKLVCTLASAASGRLEQSPLLADLFPAEKVHPRGKATATAGDPDWNFEEGEKVISPRRRRRGGVPEWAWAAGVAAVLVLILGAILFATRGGAEGRPRQGARNNSPPTSRAHRPSGFPPTWVPKSRDGN
jgi:hypothetical protein